MGVAHPPEAEVIRDLLSACRITAQVHPEVRYCGSWSLSTALTGGAACILYSRSEGLTRPENASRRKPR